ncbi:hypothetical protein ACFXPI_39000 [Streptomyces sp. NPDC059104]
MPQGYVARPGRADLPPAGVAASAASCRALLERSSRRWTKQP